MRILDRYILKPALNIFFGCLITFIFLYVIIDIFSHLDDILKAHIEIGLLLQYYLTYLPIIFVRVTPIACLLATLYTFARMNRENEIIAMRAAGLSVYSLIKTVVLFGFIVSIMVFLVNDKFVPSSLSLNQKLKDRMEAGTKRGAEKGHEIIDNLSMYGLRNRLFFVNRFSFAENTMEGITILEHDEHQNIIRKVVAGKGVYADGVWRFYQSITYDFDENAQIRDEPQYMEEEIMSIPETPKDFLSQRQHPDFMTIAQIDNYIWRLSRSGATTVIRNLKVDLYQRFTDPFTSVIIILLGVPFALMMKKRATGLSSLGLSIMVGFLYYIANAVSLALGKAGILLPVFSATLSHIAAFITAIYFLKTLP